MQGFDSRNLAKSSKQQVSLFASMMPQRFIKEPSDLCGIARHQEEQAQTYPAHLRYQVRATSSFHYSQKIQGVLGEVVGFANWKLVLAPMTG